MLMNHPTLPADYAPYVREDELLRALELIRQATAPMPDDGSGHEAAHDLADAVLKRVEARRLFEVKRDPKTGLLLADMSAAEVRALAETETPEPKAGVWTLTEPGGRRSFYGNSPIQCVRHEINYRVPPQVALARIAVSSTDDAPPPIAWGSDALRDVAAERRRQIEAEGYDPAHDDEHDQCELGRAAACYAVGSPWGGHWPAKWEFKYDGGPKMGPGHRRHLVKAGALILAEIERLDRAA